MNQKIVIPVLLGVAILLAGGVFLLNQSPEPQPTPNPSPSPSPAPQLVIEVPDDWLTYRNDEFGFEVRYPEDWVVESIDETHLRIFDPEQDKQVKAYYEECFKDGSTVTCDDPYSPGMFMSIEKYPDTQTLEPWLEGPNDPSRSIYTTGQKMQIGSLQVVKGSLWTRINPDYYYFLNPTGNIGFIVEDYNLGDDPSNDSVYQILSTFRFVN